MTNAIFTLHRGTTPLLLSLPQVGTQIPDPLKPLLVERALAVEDTDWHLEALYGFALELGASVIVPVNSRFLIDLNRSPENVPMYPGVNNTELCPTRFFTGDPIYRTGCAPTPEQVAQRRERYWQPYHDALTVELARLKASHGHAMLWDGHSIRSQLPWLFDGQLPDLNLGTAAGTSCSAKLRAALMQVLSGQSSFSHVTDGRFKGGYITRQYGKPANGIQVVQLEKCWSSYMDESPPWVLAPDRVARLTPLLRSLLRTMLAWRPDA